MLRNFQMRKRLPRWCTCEVRSSNRVPAGSTFRWQTSWVENAGTLIALSERGLDKAGNILAFLIGGPSPGGFTVKRSASYDISDAALLPGGDLLVLERKFSWTGGLTVRMRRIALADIKPGALVDGPALFEADLGYEIDNMEGLSVHRGPGGA